MGAIERNSTLENQSGTGLQRILDLQLDYFYSGRTKEVGFRLEQLRRLLSYLEKTESKIATALKQDLGKSFREAYMTELGLVKHEIRFFQKNLPKLVKPRRVGTPVYLAPASSNLYPEPLGRTLIISPWNYPFMLTMVPLIGSIAAGNCCVIKPSEYSSYTSQVIADIIEEIFPEEYVSCFLGGVETSQELLAQKWDHVFFTGSPQVGKVVAKACAENLCPVTLELGGKSPAVVTSRANISMAARRIVFGKSINAGQTCVAPDYVLVHSSRKEQLIEDMKNEIRNQLGKNPQQNPGFGRIISERHFNRLVDLLSEGSILFGGDYDNAERYISLTLVEDMEPTSRLANEEIFGPILPIFEYEKNNELTAFINSKPKPLAAYFFSEDEEEIENFRHKVSFGGGCVNDTLIHLSNINLPFGGVGNSGMGSYHGEYSFNTFSHYKSVVRASTKFDLPIRYLPFSGWKERLLKVFLP